MLLISKLLLLYNGDVIINDGYCYILCCVIMWYFLVFKFLYFFVVCMWKRKFFLEVLKENKNKIYILELYIG